MASTSSSTELDYDDSCERRLLQKKSYSNGASSSSSSSSKLNTKKSNYGSLRKEISQTAQVFIVNYKHKLKPGETLQGISLKYGVPIENIKRANRLWSNDLAFIKDILLVPMDKDRLKELNLSIDDNDDLLSHSSSVNGNINNTASSSSTENPTNSLDFNKYLNKFDTIINESKLKLKTLETTSNKQKNFTSNRKSITNNELADDEDDDLFRINNNNKKSLNGRKNHTAESLGSNDSLKQKKNDKYNSSNNNNSSDYDQTVDLNAKAPELLITSPNKYMNYYNSNHNLISTANMNGGNSTTTNGRARVAQENLQRLEREKDDLYEL